MSISFLTTLSEEEFKAFLKKCVQEVLQENLPLLQNQKILPDILDIKQAATFLKLKITTLYEKTSRKLIPHFKKGNKLYFKRPELEQWIGKGKVKTQEELGSDAITYLNTK